MKNLLFCVCILLVIPAIVYGKKEILIGALFHNDSYFAEIAFNYSIQRVNTYEKNFEFVPIIRHISKTDSFKAEKVTCELTREGVAAIFGPGSIQTSGIVSSICNRMEIPHIIAHYENEPMGGRRMQNSYTFNVYPDAEELARAYAELINDYNWDTYTIVYEDDYSLMRLKEIFQNHRPQDPPVTIKQLEGDDFRPLIKEIQKSGSGRIILDISTEKILPFFIQAAELNMIGEYLNYVLTSLDTHTVDFSQLKDIDPSYVVKANITTLRLINGNSDVLADAVNDWRSGERNQKRVFNVREEFIPTQAALYRDAVNLFGTTFRQIDSTNEIQTEKLNCKNPTPWLNGSILVNYMKKKANTEVGITGDMLFEEGRRIQFYIEILELENDEFKKIAIWNPIDGITYTRSQSETQIKIVETLSNKHFIIVSKLGEPFFMAKEIVNGVQTYEGFVVDLVKKIAEHLKFSYTLEPVPDNKYGSYDKKTKKWDGMVKHLLDRKADLAVADLTITYERRTAVDFTMPFMTLGISILFAKPHKQTPDLFSFLSPLSDEVWIYTATAYLGVSILIFILSRMSPADWEVSHPCDQDAEEINNIWNMLNCVWLTMGSIMGQGCDILPKAVATRLVAGMWYFFALIMLASYTANLAAFLTMERMDVTINNAEDLAKQSKIKYGTVTDGSTMKFFQDSNFSTFQKMWATMESTKPSVFTGSNAEGRERVRQGKRQYAFLMESTPLEYFTERYCDLTQVGDLLDSKGYGIALPLDSPYRTPISETVLKLQETGVLQQLKINWWKATNCTKEKAASNENELGIKAVGGVFVVLGFGCCFALMIAIFEFLWNVKKVAIEEKVSLGDAFKSEIKFVLNFSITTKPIHKRLSESKMSLSRSQFDPDARSFKKSQQNIDFDNGNNSMGGGSYKNRSLININKNV